MGHPGSRPQHATIESRLPASPPRIRIFELACHVRSDDAPAAFFERCRILDIKRLARRQDDPEAAAVHADDTPALLAGDTAWALPWRATVEQCRIYAADRQAKGFSATRLMTVQPDM